MGLSLLFVRLKPRTLLTERKPARLPGLPDPFSSPCRAPGTTSSASASFLKCVLVIKDCCRYFGSSTIVVTVNHWSPFDSLWRSKYSVTTAFSLYGTPFLRR